MLGATALPLFAQACERQTDGRPHVERFRALNPPILTPCEVRRARQNQAILSKPEWISIDPAFTEYLEVGDQCRIDRGEGHFALYTVGEVRNESQDERIRMALAARQRLATNSPFLASLDTQVVADGLSDAEAASAGEFVERLVDDGVSTSVIAIAPHGGFIERYTDDQAERVQAALAGKGASSWLCKGFKPGGGAFARWHITSTDISPNSFPGLDQIAGRGFAYAVAFHGVSHETVLIGGGADYALRLAIRDAIALVMIGSGISVEVADEDDLYNGDSPNNVVNWLTAGGTGGIQIEQSYAARRDYGLAIADAVAAVLDLLV